jgi:hypothetical protein
MTDLAGLRERWRELGIKVFVEREPDGEPRLRAKIPPGVATPEILAELAAAKPALIASVREARGERRIHQYEERQRRYRDILARIRESPESYPWREELAGLPADWQRRWGIRAHRLKDLGHRSDRAEWQAYWQTALELVEAEDRGEVPAKLDPDASADLERG